MGGWEVKIRDLKSVGGCSDVVIEWDSKKFLVSGIDLRNKFYLTIERLSDIFSSKIYFRPLDVSAAGMRARTGRKSHQNQLTLYINNSTAA